MKASIRSRLSSSETKLRRISRDSSTIRPAIATTNRKQDHGAEAAKKISQLVVVAQKNAATVPTQHHQQARNSGTETLDSDQDRNIIKGLKLVPSMPACFKGTEFETKESLWSDPSTILTLQQIQVLNSQLPGTPSDSEGRALSTASSPSNTPPVTPTPTHPPPRTYD